MEEVIKHHPGVNEACVVGIPDPSCMELPIAAIQKRNGQKVEPQEIFQLLKSMLIIPTLVINYYSYTKTKTR